ncbi:MAG: Fic family protein [Deltaproteobacteria bacterium]|jgi:hypothetical protein|nr:Fic family protein [Deltaproteobacteria bacterium]
MTEIYHKWEPIADLPEDYQDLSDPSFQDIAREWVEARKKIKTVLFDEFKEKISREWAIETGQVESVYHVDDNLAKTMIEDGLSSVELPSQTNGLGHLDPMLIIENHYDIVNSIYEYVRSGWQLVPYAIRGMHAAFVQNQDYAVGIKPTGGRVRIHLLKGEYKKWPNNPHTKDGLIHQYCPPEQVASEMERLLKMHESHMEDNVPPDIEAAWLHHRFIQIHPFQDGNGRVARALASLVYIKAGFFPPVVKAAGKPEYIDALDKANNGDLKPFTRYLSGLVAKTTLRCIDFARRFPDGGPSADPATDGA